MKKRNIGLEILEGIKEIKEFKEGNKCLVTREMSNSYPAPDKAKLNRECQAYINLLQRHDPLRRMTILEVLSELFIMRQTKVV